MGAKEELSELLRHGDIEVGGRRPQDITVHNEEFFSRVLANGNLGAGESYMDSWWDCGAIDQFFDHLLRANLQNKLRPWQLIPLVMKSKVMNLQTPSRSKTVAQRHYDVGNDLYKLMLDKHMQYTCGYWKDAKNLDQAQEAKLKLVCMKLGLKKGMTVLELGCGFGGFAYYAAKHYGCIVTSYNISKEQIAYGREWCKKLPVTFVEADYRTATGTFDRVVTIGMMEHVGYKNYGRFFQLIHDRLSDKGLALIHTIGSSKSVTHTDPWIDKYIFPHGNLPSIAQIGPVLENKFTVEDWHNFGADYDRTLMAWHANFIKGWPKLKDKYGDRFYRMWVYYLLSCAGGFRARKMQLWQLVLSKEGLDGGYRRVS